jgi:hypothetical protein
MCASLHDPALTFTLRYAIGAHRKGHQDANDYVDQIAQVNRQMSSDIIVRLISQLPGFSTNTRSTG